MLKSPKHKLPVFLQLPWSHCAPASSADGILADVEFPLSLCPFRPYPASFRVTLRQPSQAKKINENIISLTTEINDTGVGISQSDLEKIFEPYYQGIISDDVENLGAGLGLSLCKELVELYSGNISVNSELNKGTTVKFSINLNINK